MSSLSWFLLSRLKMLSAENSLSTLNLRHRHGAQEQGHLFFLPTDEFVDLGCTAFLDNIPDPPNNTLRLDRVETEMHVFHFREFCENHQIISSFFEKNCKKKSFFSKTDNVFKIQDIFPKAFLEIISEFNVAGSGYGLGSVNNHLFSGSKMNSR